MRVIEGVEGQGEHPRTEGQVSLDWSSGGSGSIALDWYGLVGFGSGLLGRVGMSWNGVEWVGR